MKKVLVAISVIALLAGAAQANAEGVHADKLQSPVESPTGDTADYRGIMDSFLARVGIDDHDYKILVADGDAPSGGDMLIDKLKFLDREWPNAVVTFKEEKGRTGQKEIKSITLARTIEKHGIEKASRDYDSTLKSIEKKHAPLMWVGEQECKAALGKRICYSSLQYGNVKYESGFDFQFFMIKISEVAAK